MRFIVNLLTAVLFASLAGPTLAQETRIGDLLIERPWTRATPAGAPVAGGYMRITNRGATPDRLIGGSADVARAFELHEMATIDGVMRMRPIAGGIVIAPGQTIELRPGGLHVMFMGLQRQLRLGERVRGTLVFERAGSVTVEYDVQAMGSPGHAH
jgi:copper(I)-binding protein